MAMVKTGGDGYVTKTQGAIAGYKMTPAAKARMIQAAGKGLSHRLCAAAGGISAWTFRNWLTRGQKNLEDAEKGNDELNEWGQFYLDFEQAQATLAEGILEKVAAAAGAGPQYWAAGMTLLERRFPEDYGQKRIAGEEGKVEIVITYRDDWRNLGRSETNEDAIDAEFESLPSETNRPQLTIPSSGTKESSSGTETI